MKWNNHRRAAAAEAITEAHAQAIESICSSAEEQLIDLLTNLHHYARRQAFSGGDPAAKLGDLLRIAADHFESEESGEYRSPPGSAACPHCGSVWLDSDHAGNCCEDMRGYDDDDAPGDLFYDPDATEIFGSTGTPGDS